MLMCDCSLKASDRVYFGQKEFNMAENWVNRLIKKHTQLDPFERDAIEASELTRKVVMDIGGAVARRDFFNAWKLLISRSIYAKEWSDAQIREKRSDGLAQSVRGHLTEVEILEHNWFSARLEGVSGMYFDPKDKTDRVFFSPALLTPEVALSW